MFSWCTCERTGSFVVEVRPKLIRRVRNRNVQFKFVRVFSGDRRYCFPKRRVRPSLYGPLRFITLSRKLPVPGEHLFIIIINVSIPVVVLTRLHANRTRRALRVNELCNSPDHIITIYAIIALYK